MVMLRCLALVVLLSASVYVEGRSNGLMGPPFYWTDWEDHRECSVLCGTGRLHQKQYLKCFPNYESPTCIPKDIERVHFRFIACNTTPCGDICPPGEIKFIPHSTNTGRFYQCAFGRAFLHRCPPKTVWAQAMRRCVWPYELKQ